VLEAKLKAIGWDDSMMNRPVNEGFSGGEKKRNEILQLAVLEPVSPFWMRPIQDSISTR